MPFRALAGEGPRASSYDAPVFALADAIALSRLSRI
jgi:hypothetical protein